MYRWMVPAVTIRRSAPPASSAEFERLGILGEWDKPYLTMNYVYEGITARELAEFAANGGLFKGKKPVHWCSSCVTALAEAEVETARSALPSIAPREASRP